MSTHLLDAWYQATARFRSHISEPLKHYQVRALVAQLSSYERQQLRQGPLRQGCQVCEALKQSDSDAAHTLMKFHMGMDVYPPHRQDMIGHTRLCWRRCMNIYRAAEQTINAI